MTTAKRSMRMLSLIHKLIGHSEVGAVQINVSPINHPDNDRDFLIANITFRCRCGGKFTGQYATLREGVDGFLSSAQRREKS